MELERAESTLLGRGLHLARRVIPEDAHRGDERRQIADDGLGPVGGDEARGVFDENEAEGVGPGRDGEPRIV